MYSNDLSEHRRLGRRSARSTSAASYRSLYFTRGLHDWSNAWERAASRTGGEVLFPGEPELRQRERRWNEGIPLGIQTLEESSRLATSFGLSPLAE